ncbi:MAG: hypothetical protein CRN43_05710 [Candidatus Nephrothrix sp. EaCA]|nr:MAG: hypothetical protein CRN43_05710 [Candidatus Nephrothrix sp. EaCA]
MFGFCGGFRFGNKIARKLYIIFHGVEIVGIRRFFQIQYFYSIIPGGRERELIVIDIRGFETVVNAVAFEQLPGRSKRDIIPVMPGI